MLAVKNLLGATDERFILVRKCLFVHRISGPSDLSGPKRLTPSENHKAAKPTCQNKDNRKSTDFIPYRRVKKSIMGSEKWFRIRRFGATYLTNNVTIVEQSLV